MLENKMGEMTYGRKKRGLVDRDISKIGFRV